jgi:curved DNA-binding protein CbpA
MLYFAGLTSAQEIRSRYKDLAKQYHPDKGGCVETMAAINNQYERVIVGCYQEAEDNFDLGSFVRVEREIMAKTVKVSALTNVEVELCGSWIWITGNTWEVREFLKSEGFKWANKKKAWYWHNEPMVAKPYRGKMSLDEIRQKHGSERLRQGFSQSRMIA